MRSSWKAALVAVLVASVVPVVGAAPALAGPPSNDTEASATEIGSLPFTDSVDTTGATPGGPRFCSNNASVFYRFRPSRSVAAQIDTIGSDYDTVLGVYRRSASGAVIPVRCNDDRFELASGVRFRARAGVTYFVIVGECCGNGRRGGGLLSLTVAEAERVSLTYSLEITDPGTVDPATGIATVSGTVTCSAPSFVYEEGTLRQIRGGIFVARGYWWVAVECVPDEPVAWSREVDTDTGVAFGAGAASIVSVFAVVSDGWREVVREETVVYPVRLA
jgi:hypothetical protein